MANVIKMHVHKKTSVCYDFLNRGTCPRGTYCRFSHQASSEQEKKDQKILTDNCEKCGKKGHRAAVCRGQKIEVPRALMLDSDGTQVSGHMLCVDDSMTGPSIELDLRNRAQADMTPVCMTALTQEGMTMERFFADTGANRSIHPNPRVASEYYRFPMDISTAQGNKAMRSEGVGRMDLFTPSGTPMPGFGKVVFSKQAAEKLASVGDICDAGMVCVLTSTGMKIDDENVAIKGNVISGSPVVNREIIAALRVLPPHDPKTELVPQPTVPLTWPDVPDCIAEDSLVCANLTRAYAKEGMSDLERWHGKLGDVGLKAIKRAVPSLKVPKKFRCEFCIDGKIHKFGHSKCSKGERTEYLPGECIHSDHSGP